MMKKFWMILLVILAIPLVTLGILFLIAASGTPARLLPALALLVVGCALLVVGLRGLRRLAEINPEAVKTGAVQLAQRLGGELTVSQLRAEYRIPQELAARVLEELVAEGNAKREQREERLVYVFTGLLASLKEKSCPYCGTKLPVRSALRKCPNCGASLEITKT
jgi:hypothetical protein